MLKSGFGSIVPEGITLILVAGLVSALALPSCTEHANRQDKETSPNVLFILSDDQRADAMGCAGNPYIRTPHLDQLAENGIQFGNTYVMGGHHGAICAPSRAMLLSGKSLFNVYDRLDGIETMPMSFRENGYITFGTGKWHNERSAFEAGFQHGKNVFLGGMGDHFNIACRDIQADGTLSEAEMRGFSTDLFAGATIDFLHEYASGERDNPFFCYLSFTAPHDPYSPRNDHIDMYPAGGLPLPGNFMPLHPFQFDNLTIRDENLAPWPRAPEMIRAALADYYALITHMDEQIGEVIDVLKKHGLFENTIIVFTADNGLAIGSHGLLGKQNLYEHSTKVPLIISGPGIPKGDISDALVYLFDLYPTLAELCGLPEPEEIDGISLKPMLVGQSADVRSSLFTAYRHTIRAVRTSEWKLIRYPERDFTQLYNLKNDPLELNNLSQQPEYMEKSRELLQLMADWQTATNDTIPLTAETILPMEYDHTQLERKPDQWQPGYTLNKYFTPGRWD